MIARPQSVVELLQLMRDPKQGCQWSREQTLASLKRFTREEIAELLSAIDSGNWDAIKDELSDLLLHLAYYSQIAAENQLFDFSAVEQHCIDKQLRRKPYLLDEAVGLCDIATAKTYWRSAKAAEAKDKPAETQLNKHLDMLSYILRLQKHIELDDNTSPTPETIAAYLSENITDIMTALEKNNIATLEQTLSQHLFHTLNLCRQFELSPHDMINRLAESLLSNTSHGDKKSL